MSTIDPEHGWKTCPPGALGQLDRRLRARRRSLLLRESSLLILMAALIGITAGYLASPGAKPPTSSGPFDFAGISCGEVQRLLPALAANRLDPDKAVQVRQHVLECPQCGPLMERMQARESIGRTRSHSSRIALASAGVVSRSAHKEL